MGTQKRLIIRYIIVFVIGLFISGIPAGLGSAADVPGVLRQLI